MSPLQMQRWVTLGEAEHYHTLFLVQFKLLPCTCPTVGRALSTVGN